MVSVSLCGAPAALWSEALGYVFKQHLHFIFYDHIGTYIEFIWDFLIFIILIDIGQCMQHVGWQSHVY